MVLVEFYVKLNHFKMCNICLTLFGNITKQSSTNQLIVFAKYFICSYKIHNNVSVSWEIFLQFFTFIKIISLKAELLTGYFYLSDILLFE